jgi:hypothetical protein
MTGQVFEVVIVPPSTLNYAGSIIMGMYFINPTAEAISLLSG